MPLTDDAELTVTFVDASTPTDEITYWSWDFGDGSAIYEGQTPPAHLYDTPGVYTVTLHVASDKGIDTFTDTVTVSDPLNPAVTGVALTPTTGPVGGLSVTVRVSPQPVSSGRTVTVGWYKDTGETIANLHNIGTAVWNAGTSKYEVLWTFPSCGALPDGKANLVAYATGWDGVTAMGLSACLLNGRGC
jgi:PKD repeat protein